MNDVVKNVQEELIEVNMNDGGEARPVKVSKSLPKGERRMLVALLKEYKDVFAWNYEEILGLNPKSVTYKLNVNPKVKPVKQPTRKCRLDIEEKIKVEVNKLFKVGFLEEIKCLEWLANLVLVKKKGK